MMYGVNSSFPFSVYAIGGFVYSHPRDTFETRGFAKVESANRRINHWKKKLDKTNKKNKQELRKKISKIRRARDGYIKNAPEDFI